MIHVERAAAMSAFFLEKAGGRMHDLKLAKLQYLAEREALICMLSPIVADDAVSLYHGPCLSQTLSLTNDSAEDSFWDGYIGFVPYVIAPEKSNTVVLRNRIEWSEFLSPADIEILESLWNRHGRLDWRELMEWCRGNLPEHTEVEYGAHRWIQLEEIFKGAGDDPVTALAKANEVRYHLRFERQYGRKIPVPA